MQSFRPAVSYGLKAWRQKLAELKHFHGEQVERTESGRSAVLVESHWIGNNTGGSETGTVDIFAKRA